MDLRAGGGGDRDREYGRWPDIPGHPQVTVLGWEAFARDLRLARQWCNDLLNHSLEGCVEQGFLPWLRDFEWDRAEPPPAAAIAAALRHVLRGILWASAHPVSTLAMAAATVWLASGPLRPRLRSP